MTMSRCLTASDCHTARTYKAPYACTRRRRTPRAGAGNVLDNIRVSAGRCHPLRNTVRPSTAHHCTTSNQRLHPKVPTNFRLRTCSILKDRRLNFRMHWSGFLSPRNLQIVGPISQQPTYLWCANCTSIALNWFCFVQPCGDGPPAFGNVLDQ